MPRPDLVVVGDVMVDVSVAAGALASGGDVHGEVRMRPGGSAANAAVWAAEAGARVVLYGRVGRDVAGRVVTEALAERGVHPAFTEDPDRRTGTMLVVHEAGERSMVADRGANAGLRPEDLPERLEATAVLVSGYILFPKSSRPAAVAALDRARARFVAVDAASWPLVERLGPDRFRDLTAPANLILANEPEARALTGLEGEEAALALAETYGRAAVKLGARGALWAEGGTVARAGGPPVEESDPTGAGDAFDGVLLAGLAAARPLEEVLRDACAAGARAAASPESWPER